MQRKATHAGTFYPRFADQLLPMIHAWEETAVPGLKAKRSLALITPHAGLIYSGQTAALGFRLLSTEVVDSFIILHPCHQAGHFKYSISPYDSYECPLGELFRDEELAQELDDLNEVSVHPGYHLKEHSMEIQLPLIRHYFPGAKILPIMLGRQSPENSVHLASRLYEIITRSKNRIVVVASSDLSHYHHAKTAMVMDHRLEERLLQMDSEGLWEDICSGKTEACGIGAIQSLMHLAKLFSSAAFETVSYSHSGMVSHNNQQVVGYISARLAI
ncbi:MAG TPA: AmmeMemoRadiSam system protein B [Candidatus Cloacimonadota bacterium]|nr:AmmeMemoRadiSam system protein B [Candidatus Cloacimonadota bacterium]